MINKLKFLLICTMIIAIFLCISDAYNKYKDSASENTPSISFNDYCEKDPEFNEINKKIESLQKEIISILNIKLVRKTHREKLYSLTEDLYSQYKQLAIRIFDLKIKYVVQHDIDRRIYILKDTYLNLYERKNWINAFTYAFIFIFLPPLCFRAILYWIISPIVQNKGSLQFFESMNQNSNTIRISDNEQKSLKADILPNESLLVVDESFVNGCEDNQNLEKTLQWLFSWKHPIMSFWCGLRTMNKYTNKSEKSISIDITSNDPDDYFIEIELDNCKGAFILPSNIKALSPTINIDCKWRLFSLVSWCMLRIRYYVVSGSGKIILSSKGGFRHKKKNTDIASHRRKPSSLIFADTNLKWNAIRTEIWYPYIIGKTDLFDLRITGKGNYLIKNILYNDNIKLTSPESLLNIIGKLAGF